MTRIRPYATALGAALILAGCNLASDSLWPALSGKETSSSSRQSESQTRPAISAAGSQAMAVNAPRPAPPPKLGNLVPRAAATATGTVVGGKIAAMRADLSRLKQTLARQSSELQAVRDRTRANTQSFHANVGAVNARLQFGTTPGNPTLISKWNSAQADLARIDNDIAAMNAMANSVAGTSTLSAYLLQTAQAAYGLTGAVEADHRELARIEDEVNRTVVQIDRLLTEMSQDINRQITYLGAERSNLTALSMAIKSGEPLGGNLARRATLGAPLMSRAVARGPATTGSGTAKIRRPLVIIRFDRPNVTYAQALYTAVSRALERRSDAMFDLVAVAPTRGSAAQVTLASNDSKRNAKSVLRSLTDMGLPLERVRLSAMTSGGTQSPEVHLYVR